MAQQTINVGTAPNDGTGTPLRTAFQYTNSNFTELYTATGPSGNNINVPGAATITGNLTVDTNTLFVDSANNRVGVGTVTPAAAIAIDLPEVSSAAGTSAIIYNNTGGGNRIAALRLQNLSNQWNIRAYGSVTDDLRFSSGATGSEVDYLSIGNTGIFTWSNVGGVAGTAMTLNSTGLGLGASPSYKLDVNGVARVSSGGDGVFLSSASSPDLYVVGVNYYNNNGTEGVQVSARPSWKIEHKNSSDALAYLDIGFRAASAAASAFTSRFKIDGSGNLGTGVTPSAWNSSAKAFEIGTAGNSVFSSAATFVEMTNNAYLDSVSNWVRVNTGNAAARFRTSGSGFLWLQAAAGANPITWTTAMTLDASGNLLVGLATAGTTAAKTIQIANGTAPTANVAGGQLYVEAGALKYRGSSGTVTTIANA